MMTYIQTNTKTIRLNSLPVIRRMEKDDLQPVMEIDRLSFNLPWSESAYQYELFENPNSRLWVAEVPQPDGKSCVVGMIVVWLILDETHIATLAVHPDYRQKGVAQQLLTTALIQIIHEGSSLATLEVRANNIIGQRLYRQFGFVIVGNRPRYYRDNNEDAIIMTVNGLGNEYLHWLESGARQIQSDIQPAISGDAC
jgi:ribosomal-protein-alanine N-acetyltransferase